MNNLTRIFMENPGIASVIASLVIWYEDSADGVHGADLHAWLLREVDDEG